MPAMRREGRQTQRRTVPLPDLRARVEQGTADVVHLPGVRRDRLGRQVRAVPWVQVRGVRGTGLPGREHSPRRVRTETRAVQGKAGPQARTHGDGVMVILFIVSAAVIFVVWLAVRKDPTY